MPPEVAIVTRTRDRLPLLSRTIDSVLAQKHGDWTHVIVNDGGDAEALETLLNSRREAYGNRLQVIHNARSSGMQNAANSGIQGSSSTFIAILDDDDAWHPDFLQATVGCLNEHGTAARYQGVAVQTTKVLETLDSGRVREVEREPYQPIKEVSLFRVGYENPFPPVAFLFRRAAYDAVGPFDERFGPVGDMDFNIRFLLRFEIDVLPQPLAYYHWRTGDTTGALGNTVTASRQHHARLLNELKNHYLRQGSEAAPAALGLSLNLVNHLLAVEWNSRLANEKLDKLSDAVPTTLDLKALNDEVLWQLRDQLLPSFAKEVSSKIEEISWKLNDTSIPALREDLKSKIEEISWKLNDTSIPALREDLKSKIDEAVWKLESGQLSQLNARMEATEAELKRRKLLWKIGRFEVCWNKQS